VKYTNAKECDVNEQGSDRSGCPRRCRRSGSRQGGAGSGGKKTRRLPIQRRTDVAVPVETAYKSWSDFEEYPKFMHRVLHVEKTGRNKIRWQEKIWFSRRQWEATITERRTNDRIVWKTTSGMSHRGVVSFHKLEPNLTRVMVEMEFEPNGMVEKMASGAALREARRPGRPRPLQGPRRDGGRERDRVPGRPGAKRRRRRRGGSRRLGLARLGQPPTHEPRTGSF